MAKIPVTRIDDNALRANPYLGLHTSGQIRPGAAEQKADQTMGMIAQQVPNIEKMIVAKAASEDKTSIVKGATEFDQLIANTRLSVADGDPTIAESTFNSTVDSYKKMIMSDERLSAISRDQQIAYIDKARIPAGFSVTTAAAIKQGKIEVAELQSFSNGKVQAAIDAIRTGNPSEGTSGFGEYLAGMEEGLPMFMAGVGTSFISREQAKTAFDEQVGAGYTQILQSMLASNDPAYAPQIEEMFIQTKYNIPNHAQLLDLFERKKLHWKNDEVSSTLRSYSKAINTAAGKPNPVMQQVLDLGNLPSYAPLLAVLEKTYEEAKGNERINMNSVASSGLTGVRNFYSNNVKDMKKAKIISSIAEFQKLPLFAGSDIEWEKEKLSAYDKKARHTADLLTKTDTALAETIESSALTPAAIDDVIEATLGKHELLFKNPNGTYLELSENDAKAALLIPQLNKLRNFAQIGDEDHQNFLVLADYIENTLNKGTEILGIMASVRSKVDTLSVHEDQANRYLTTIMTNTAVDDTSNMSDDDIQSDIETGTRNEAGSLSTPLEPKYNAFIDPLTPQTKAILDKNINALMADPNTAHLGLEIWKRAADNGDILSSASKYIKDLLDLGDYAGVVKLASSLSEKNANHVKTLFGDSVFDSNKHKSSLATLTNIIAHGSDTTLAHVVGLLNEDPGNLGSISHWSEKAVNWFKATFTDTTSPEALLGNYALKRIDALNGQPDDGTVFTDTEVEQNAHVVGILLFEKFGTGAGSPEEVEEYMDTSEFADAYTLRKNGSSIQFNYVGNSNSINLKALDGFSPEQIGHVRDEANSRPISPWNGMDISNALVIGYGSFTPRTPSNGRRESGQGGGVIYKAAQAVLDADEMDNTLIDMTNTFVIPMGEGSDLTSGAKADLMAIPYKRGGQVAGYLLFEVTDGGVEPVNPNTVPGSSYNGVVSVDPTVLSSGVTSGEAGDTSRLISDLMKLQRRLSSNHNTTLRKNIITQDEVLNTFLNLLPKTETE